MDAASLDRGHETAVAPAAPPGAPGPFALSDEDGPARLCGIAGGLTPVAVLDVESPWFYRDEATALRGIGSSGVAVAAALHAGEAAVEAANRAALAPFRRIDGSYRVGARARCLVAAP
jgi:hypothetical protein